MALNENTVDLGGMTLRVNNIEVGSTGPGVAGTDLSGTEITYLDGVTPGTATASKAVVLDGSKGIATITSATITTLASTTGNVTTINATDVNATGTADVGTLTVGSLVGDVQTLTGAGAVNLTTTVTSLVNDGANAITLADGTPGQIKIIVMHTDPGTDSTLTPTTFHNGTTVTFDDAGDYIILVWLATIGWVSLGASATIA